MRKLFILVLVVIMVITGAFAQQFNNEWIDYNKTYYKFKIGETGLYRIPQATLAGAGLANTPASQFKLFRNGQEVPLYIPGASGPLSATGYIEFWGEQNDGRADKMLYRDPASQHSDKWSLQTDTAVYFLLVNPGNNFRLTQVPNEVASNTLPAEPFFMHTTGTHFRDRMNPGFAQTVGEYVYSSSYERGEFWSTQEIYPGTPRSDVQNNLFVHTGGANATIKFGLTGNAFNSRSFRVSVNGTVVSESALDFFKDTVTQASIPISLISANTANIQFSNSSTISTDRMVVSYYDMVYPRQFNFGGSKKFVFELPGRNEGYHLEIRNFDFGSQAPVLYDLEYEERFVGEITGNIVRFALPGTNSARKMVLVNSEAASVKNITTLTPKTFINFNSAGNQGNYLIISNPLLYQGANGANPVTEYKNYRNSQQGGRFNSQVYEIDELVDQFAFGIKKHPLSIKNFLRFARSRFAAPPRFVLLIGRGVAYNEYRQNEADPLADRLNLVPSYGYPSSDNFLSSPNAVNALPVTPIGRLSVVSATELEDYLEKVKEYEQAQVAAPNNIAGRLWMKNVIHVTGASDSYLGTVLCSYMDAYRQIIEDTLVGGSVTVFCKTTTNPVEQLSNERIAGLFQEGLSMVTYFGHSSSTTLEFNLDNPQNYNNQGKYPVFSVNGCNAGNFFTFDPQRFTYNETLSEKFVLAKQRGGIAFIASTHFGIVNYLNVYINSFYNHLAKTDYGASLGQVNRDALERVVTVSGNNDYFARIHVEEVTLHGDPALKMNFQALPDYVIEEPQVKISPAFISIAEDKFKLSINLFNLGKAVKDSIVVEVKRQYPDGNQEIIYRRKRRGIYYNDSLSLEIPVVGTRDKGLNKITISVDADNSVTEITESNNIITKEFFIYEDEAKTAYPYNFSIVNSESQKLYASTANPFSSLKQYVMEMDTTELYNSPSKLVKNLSSAGGLLEFDPGILYRDSMVYYWRVASVPTAGNGYRWNGSSFIFLKGGTAGFNQSHYYQHASSGLTQISLDQSNVWKFGSINNDLYVRAGTWTTGVIEEAGVSISVNGKVLGANACAFSSLVINVFDPVTFKPWINTTDPSTNEGRYGSWANNCYPGREINFEYRYTDTGSRRRLMHFMDNIIPDGAYVVVRSFALDPSATVYGIPPYSNFPQAFVSDWKGDTTYFGAGNSLYHRFLQLGFASVDSFYRPRNFVFLYKKNEGSRFTPKSVITEGVYDNVILPADCPTPDTLGYITSPLFGPAKAWKNLHWRGSSQEANSADNPTIDVIGIDSANVETRLLTVNLTMQDVDISFIKADRYPNIRLKMRNSDSISLTPYQLKYWRLDYDPIPEGALAPNLFFTTKDTLEVGEKLQFGIAFKNISQAAFDSIRVKLVVIDKDNVPHPIILPRKKPLLSGDTLMLRYEIDTKDFPEMNTLYVDFNPDNDQREQYLYNNFVYRNFYVKPDKVNPLLDVTFDGVHILNRDIVSAKPRIQIKLKDEAKFLLLNDTSLLTLQVRFPDENSTLRTYKFDNDTLRFIPAQSGTENTATIEFMPSLGKQYNSEGDDYELIVKGKDRSGNKAGEIEYRVTFRVINKPMISNLLNYPNPFTTSTAFVFTITGNEIPQNMKIQILTITGKVVREITREELGNLHIGRNITDFKWDGTDQFGQRLANGVYLYRVVTTLNGRQMEKYKAEGDETDKYFNRGYGKMYLMR
ncbi:MAG: C25 family cysteine peptidase [Chitinophagaceae bacterium]